MLDSRLQTLVAGVQAMQARANPPEDGELLDGGWLLQLELLRSGQKLEFSEGELIEALQALGVPDDDIESWFEDLASYL